MTTIDHDEAVRVRAYLLWEEAGRPTGREHEFWAQAAFEIEGQPLAAEGNGQIPDEKNAGSHGKRAATKDKA